MSGISGGNVPGRRRVSPNLRKNEVVERVGGTVAEVEIFGPRGSYSVHFILAHGKYIRLLWKERGRRFTRHLLCPPQ